MKQVVILSGKGGTGKTSISASLAHLASTAEIPAVLVDTDVDAANLELLLSPRILEEHEFIGGKVASIDPEACVACGLCEQVCRFDAILEDQGVYHVDSIGCEGCAACFYQCPSAAIKMESQVVGHWFLSDSRYGPLFHAALRPAQENSGKLVALVKQKAHSLALDEKYPLVLVDGPPGIGCPAISAITGASFTLIIAESTLSGVHDMERAVQMVQHFGIPIFVCINKADIYPEGTNHIEEYCQQQNIAILARIPFDTNVTHAMLKREPVTAFCPDCPASQAIVAVWHSLENMIQTN
ncbi:MAG: ATP-binding protein [Anaerolineaceae bacterium]